MRTVKAAVVLALRLEGRSRLRRHDTVKLLDSQLPLPRPHNQPHCKDEDSNRSDTRSNTNPNGSGITQSAAIRILSGALSRSGVGRRRRRRGNCRRWRSGRSSRSTLHGRLVRHSLPSMRSYAIESLLRNGLIIIVAPAIAAAMPESLRSIPDHILRFKASCQTRQSVSI